MKKMQSLMTLALAVIVTMGMTLSANAQQKQCCDKGDKSAQCQQDGKGCKIPNLTDEQQKKIDDLKTAFMKEKLSFNNQIAEKKAHLKTLSMAEVTDMTAINKTIDELYALKAEFAKKKQAHIQSVRKVLNDEQRLYFDMMHAKTDGHQGCKDGGHQGQCGQQGQGCQQQGQGCQNKAGAGQGCQDKAGAGQGCQHQQGNGNGNGKGCQQHGTDDKK